MLFALCVVTLCGTQLSMPVWPWSGFMGITIYANALSVALLYHALSRGPTMLGAAVVNVDGYAAFLGGIMAGRLDETGILATLSGAVAACGAAVLLRERLATAQYRGLAATAILVPLLAAVT